MMFLGLKVEAIPAACQFASVLRLRDADKVTGSKFAVHFSSVKPPFKLASWAKHVDGRDCHVWFAGRVVFSPVDFMAVDTADVIDLTVSDLGLLDAGRADIIKDVKIGIEVANLHLAGDHDEELIVNHDEDCPLCRQLINRKMVNSGG